tara:strand:+ start:119 stop:520 length:402 start_codon:yes stop_codon:yes gene_type:complete
MFRNPFTPKAWYKIQKKWWSIVAPTLMADLKRLEEMSSREWVEYDKLCERIEKLEDRNAELERKNSLNQDGYWCITSDKNSTSCYRLDDKFIEWYKMWRSPIQMQLEFEYERKRTEAEEEKAEQLYWDDEVYR